MLVEQGRKRRAGNTQRLCCRRHRQAQRLNDLGLHEPTGMRRVLHADACNRAHGLLLVVIFIVQVDDLYLFPVDPKRHPPVSSDE